MDEMEREALRRAEKMRGAFYSDRNVHKESSKPKTKETTTNENKSSEKPKDKKVNIPKQSQNKPKEKQGNIFDTLLKDKEATIIILMIFFLYDDNCDPMLIMALIYLLL